MGGPVTNFKNLKLQQKLQYKECYTLQKEMTAKAHICFHVVTFWLTCIICTALQSIKTEPDCYGVNEKGGPAQSAAFLVIPNKFYKHCTFSKQGGKCATGQAAFLFFKCWGLQSPSRKGGLTLVFALQSLSCQCTWLTFVYPIVYNLSTSMSFWLSYTLDIPIQQLIWMGLKIWAIYGPLYLMFLFRYNLQASSIIHRTIKKYLIF